jgi:ABC-2 type transport system ATP-binding protein
MEAISEISGLRRRFDATVALGGMSFTVAPGDVTGFAGPNGAGKATTMRVILGRNHLLWLAHSQRLNARRADGPPLPTVPS